MKTLYFDTAITGRWDFSNKDPEAPRPHLVRLAMQVVDADGTAGKPSVMLAYPGEDWDFEPGAVDAHGVSRDKALSLGVQTVELLMRFVEMAEPADRLVAYAADFHMRMVRHAAAEIGWVGEFGEDKLVCAMRGARGLVPAAGNRLPKMVDAAAHFMGKPMRRHFHDPDLDGAAVLEAVIAIDRGSRALLGLTSGEVA